MNRSSPFESEVAAEDLDYVLRWQWQVPAYARGQLSPSAWSSVDAWLRDLVARRAPLRAPWPAPDRAVPEGRRAFSSWEVYSPATLREWLSGVLTAALAIYAETMRTWFPRMGGQCERFRNMPGRLVAYLNCETQERPPDFSYYIERLPRDHVSTAVVHVGPIDHAALLERAREAQPTGPVSVYSSGVNVFARRPATGTAFYWLSEELSNLQWVSTFVVPE